MPGIDKIAGTVKTYLVDEFLPGESPESLSNTDSLINGGVLDSIATVKLVSFLEEHYGVEFAAHEMSVENLDSVNDIAAMVAFKLEAK